MKINCMTILSPFGMNTDVYETILKFPTILRRLCLSKINDADQDDADQDDADQGTTSNNRKVVTHRANQATEMLRQILKLEIITSGQIRIEDADSSSEIMSRTFLIFRSDHWTRHYA